MDLWFHYPVIDPVATRLGSFVVYWYALAYSGGLLAIWVCARYLVRHGALWNGVARPSLPSIDLLIIFICLGSAIGGRIGYVILVPQRFLANPLEIFDVSKGGSSFHAAAFGACVATWLFARRYNIRHLSVLDVCAPGAAVGVALGRIANFIRPELWGRPTSVPWALVFPGVDPLPRHPSQLYEAFAEGLLLFLILCIAIRAGVLRRPGFLTGLFAIGYGIARIICEFFREPDTAVFNFSSGITMGMMLSVPMIVIGLLLISGLRMKGTT